MAKQNEHEAKAQSNQNLIAPLEKLDSHPDWVVTIKFYTCVHWFRALFARHGESDSPQSVVHYNEFSTVTIKILEKSEGRIADDVNKALAAFEDLRDLSQAARYQCLPRSWFDHQMFEVDQNVKCIQAFMESRNIQTK